MSFLTFNSTPIAVASAEASQAEDERSGSETRSYFFRLRSTIRAEKRVFKVSTKWMLLADARTFKSTYAGGVTVSVGGDLIGTPAIDCTIVFGAAAIQYTKAGAKTKLTMTVREK